MQSVDPEILDHLASYSFYVHSVCTEFKLSMSFHLSDGLDELTLCPWLSTLQPWSKLPVDGMWGLAGLKTPIHANFLTRKVGQSDLAVDLCMQDYKSCVQPLRFVSLWLTFRHTHTHTHRQHFDQLIWIAQPAELKIPRLLCTKFMSFLSNEPGSRYLIS